MDTFEALKKFKELLDLGIITQEEFDEKKASILNQVIEDPATSNVPEVVEESDAVEVDVPVMADVPEAVEESAAIEIPAADDAQDNTDAAATSNTADTVLPEGTGAFEQKAKSGIDELKNKASGLSKNAKIAIAALAVVLLLGCFAIFGGSVSQEDLTGTWVGSWVYDGDQIQEGIMFNSNGTFTGLVYHNGVATELRYGEYEIKGKTVSCHDSVRGVTTSYKYRSGKLKNNGHELTQTN